MNDIVNKAEKLAYKAHAEQVDKAGQPYINHVARVAARVASSPKVGPEAQAAAWLHDVLEDHPEYAEDVNEQMPESVIWAVRLLNRNEASSKTDYYQHIRENTAALVVKLADIDDNSNLARLAALDDKTAERLRRKYEHAREALGV